MSLRQLLALSTHPVADRVREFRRQRKINRAYRDLAYLKAAEHETRRAINYTMRQIINLETKKK